MAKGKNNDGAGKKNAEKSSNGPRKAAAAPREAGHASPQVTINRRNAQDRRKDDRRKQDLPVAVERRKLQRREKISRRRQIDPTTCERDYSAEEIEFMSALDAYKRANGRMFPTCSEILEVVRKLGYEKPGSPAPSETVAPGVSPAPLESRL